jgi:hypothetical protein
MTRLREPVLIRAAITVCVSRSRRSARRHEFRMPSPSARTTPVCSRRRDFADLRALYCWAMAARDSQSKGNISARMPLRAVSFVAAQGHDAEARCRSVGLHLASLKEVREPALARSLPCQRLFEQSGIRIARKSNASFAPYGSLRRGRSWRVVRRPNGLERGGTIQPATCSTSRLSRRLTFPRLARRRLPWCTRSFQR